MASSITAKELVAYKESLTMLQPIQRDLLIGSLLGDGNLRFLRENLEATFTIDHSLKQEDYVWYKYRILKDWVLTEPRIFTRIYHKDREKMLSSVRFSSISHSVFTSWYDIFYQEGRKIIPENIEEILVSPFSLAVWFMDDGNKNHQAVFLNTQQFLLDEQELLRECLLKNFGLHSTMNKHWVYNGKQLYRIRITTESTKELRRLTQEFILPSLKYKLPVSP
jgi:hypothetical protein